MKAAILTALNAPLEIDHLVAPSELQYGQVLVSMISSGICGAQLQEVRGEKGNAKWLPHLLGHEGCGVVSEIGPGVTRMKVGDKCVLHWRKAAGLEGVPVKYTRFQQPDGKGRIGAGPIHTFADSAIISENRLTPVPSDTSSDLCALLGCGLSTALATVENECSLKWGESILIVGCGGLGTNLIRAAKMMHAHPIYSTDVYPSKRDQALGLGATEFVEFDAWFCHTNLGPFDVIVNTAGTPASLEATLPLLGSSGRYIVVGHQPPGASWSIKNADHMFGGEGKVIKWTQGGGFDPSKDIPRYAALHKQGVLDISRIISHRISLDRINDGLDLVRGGSASRVLIDMSL